MSQHSSQLGSTLHSAWAVLCTKVHLGCLTRHGLLQGPCRPQHRSSCIVTIMRS